jgi:hypothetical protein
LLGGRSALCTWFTARFRGPAALWASCGQFCLCAATLMLLEPDHLWADLAWEFAGPNEIGACPDLPPNERCSRRAPLLVQPRATRAAGTRFAPIDALRTMGSKPRDRREGLCGCTLLGDTHLSRNRAIWQSVETWIVDHGLSRRRPSSPDDTPRAPNCAMEPRAKPWNRTRTSERRRFDEPLSSDCDVAV